MDRREFMRRLLGGAAAAAAVAAPVAVRYVDVGLVELIDVTTHSDARSGLC